MPIEMASTTQPPAKLLLTVNEAATALSLGRTFVYELVMRGELRSLKVGAARRVPIWALQDYVARLCDCQKVG